MKVYCKVLFFEQIDERRESIKDAAPRTLEWIFKEPNADASALQGSDEPWDNFPIWLRKDSSTYWIRGKAGSGKSTLMAHIVEDQRTRENLEHWSGGKELLVLSFFFWRPGIGLQNNVLGILRSLLYQIFNLSYEGR